MYQSKTDKDKTHKQYQEYSGVQNFADGGVAVVVFDTRVVNFTTICNRRVIYRVLYQVHRRAAVRVHDIT